MISIIIPYYNSSKYLDKLLFSLEKQSDKNYEAIIIDDCSKEEEKKYLMQRLKKFNINYLYLENLKNLGVGRTRNKGIKYAKGDYIVFIDSDDWIDSEFVKKINQKLLKRDIDILFFDYYRIGEKKKKYCKTLRKKRRGNTISREDSLLYVTGNVCGKVIKRNIISQNNISFTTLKRFEDWVFMTQVILKSNRISYLEEGLYYYYLNINSVTQSKREDGYFYSKKGFNILKKELLKLDIKEKKDIINLLYLRQVVYTAIKEYYCRKNFLEEMEYIYPIKNKIFTKYRKTLGFHQNLLITLYEKKCYFIIKLLCKCFFR